MNINYLTRLIHYKMKRLLWMEEEILRAKNEMENCSDKEKANIQKQLRKSLNEEIVDLVFSDEDFKDKEAND